MNGKCVGIWPKPVQERAMVGAIGGKGLNHRTAVGVRRGINVLITVMVITSLAVGPAYADATSTTRASVNTSEVEGDLDSSQPSVSADGRYVAFQSAASNLVGDDLNGLGDVFLRDRVTGTTSRVRVSSAEIEGNDESLDPAISADGRYVAYRSFASNLVSGDTNGAPDVFVRDRVTGTTKRTSVTSGGVQGNSDSEAPAISGNGRYVAFGSLSSNLVSNDTNNSADIFLHDRQTGAMRRISVSSSGAQSNNRSANPAFHYSGRHVAYESEGTNLVSGDTNGLQDVLIRDRDSDGDGVFDESSAVRTARVSISGLEQQANGDSFGPSLSSGGRYVAFESGATNLVSGDSNASSDIFLRDRTLGTTKRMSVNTTGLQANGGSGRPSISPSGRFIAFESLATNLSGPDGNGASDILMRDRDFDRDNVYDEAGSVRTFVVSVNTALVLGNSGSFDPSITNGQYVTFGSFATNLDTGDANGASDIFVRNRGPQ